MRTNTRRAAGFTLVEMMIVVAVVALLAVIAIPSFVRARTTSQAKACISNLRQLDSVKQQWALEYKQPTTAQPTPEEIHSYLKQTLICPAGSEGAGFEDCYIMGDVGQKPTCKIVGLTHVLPEDSEQEEEGG
jgi:prepilin-type N-terminal cleavage/methylation domain-containing protein